MPFILNRQHVPVSVSALSDKKYERKVSIGKKIALGIRDEIFYYDMPQNELQRERGFSLRYQVFCAEMGCMPKKSFVDKKVRDVYDTVDSTRIFLSLHPRNRDTVVGTVRAIRDPLNKLYNKEIPHTSDSNPITSLPIEKHLDLSAFRQKNKNIEQVTSLAVGKHRGKKIPFALFKCIYLDGVAHNIDYIFIQANPSYSWMFGGIGFKKIYETSHAVTSDHFTHQGKEVPVIGMYLDMHAITKEYLTYFNTPHDHFLFMKNQEPFLFYHQHRCVET